MSNLGAYQWITSTSKKVGGPINLLLLTGAAGGVAGSTAGIAIYKACEFGVKKCVKAIKSHQVSKRKCLEVNNKIYSVTSPGTSNEGVEFPIGTKFKVLEIDGDSVLIEKLGDKNNPYFVSVEFLRTISEL